MSLRRRRILFLTVILSMSGFAVWVGTPAPVSPQGTWDSAWNKDDSSGIRVTRDARMAYYAGRARLTAEEPYEEIPWHVYEARDGTWIAVNPDRKATMQGTLVVNNPRLQECKRLMRARVFVGPSPLRQLLIVDGDKLVLQEGDSELPFERRTWRHELSEWWQSWREGQ